MVTVSLEFSGLVIRSGGAAFTAPHMRRANTAQAATLTWLNINSLRNDLSDINAKKGTRLHLLYVKSSWIGRLPKVWTGQGAHGLKSAVRGGGEEFPGLRG